MSAPASTARPNRPVRPAVPVDSRAHAFGVVLGKAVRDRLTIAVLVGVLLVCLGLMVGVLWPSLRDTFATVNLPEAFSTVLGGATLTTPLGWVNAELMSVVAPASAIVTGVISGARATAGEEEDKTLGVLLGAPVGRTTFLLAKIVAMIIHVLVVSVLLVAGLVVGNRVGGLGLTAAGMIGAGLHVALLGILFGVLAVIVGAATGNKRLTNAIAGALAVLAFCISSFLPLSDAMAGGAKASPWYYFDSVQPLANGADMAHLLVLAAAAVVLAAVGILAFTRRDLRG